MGRRIWVYSPARERPDGQGGVYKMPESLFDTRVLSFNKFLPADPAVKRTKHLVQLYTDPGGSRVLSVGSILLKDPGRVAAGLASAAAANMKDQDEDDV